MTDAGSPETGYEARKMALQVALQLFAQNRMTYGSDGDAGELVRTAARIEHYLLEGTVPDIAQPTSSFVPFTTTSEVIDLS